MSEPTDQISIEDFLKVKLRVGRVVDAIVHPNADKLLVVKVDIGGEIRQICAGIRAYYAPEQLVGKNIVVVANLAPRMMRGVESQGMLLAASTPADASMPAVAGTPDQTQVVCLTTMVEVPPGCTVK